MSGGTFHSVGVHMHVCVYMVGVLGGVCMYICTQEEKEELGCEGQEHKDYLREILSQQGQGNPSTGEI